MAIKSIEDMKVYGMAYRSAMKIFDLTKKFPREEMYSLSDQIRRSSRSVAINIREGFAKRVYKQVFMRHLSDALALQRHFFPSFRHALSRNPFGDPGACFRFRLTTCRNDDSSGSDAVELGSCEETRGWLDFAFDCNYIPFESHKELQKTYDEISAMLFKLINTWRTF